MGAENGNFNGKPAMSEEGVEQRGVGEINLLPNFQAATPPRDRTGYAESYPYEQINYRLPPQDTQA